MIITVSMPVLVAAMIATGAIPEKAQPLQVASVSGAMIQPSAQGPSELLHTPFGPVYYPSTNECTA